MKQENKLIRDFKGKEKEELKNKLMKLRENLKSQNEKYFKLFLLPNENMIKAIDKFLLNSPYNQSKRYEQIGTKQLKIIFDNTEKYREKVKELIGIFKINNPIKENLKEMKGGNKNGI